MLFEENLKSWKSRWIAPSRSHYAHKCCSMLLLLPVERFQVTREQVVSRSLIILQERIRPEMRPGCLGREDWWSQIFEISVVELQVEKKGVLGMWSQNSKLVKNRDEIKRVLRHIFSWWMLHLKYWHSEMKKYRLTYVFVEYTSKIK